MNKIRVAALIQCLAFVIPINIFVVGDWLAIGIQWILFRYQISYLGESLISITNEIGYVSSRIITGNSAIVLIIWAAAALLLILAVIINLMSLTSRSCQWARKTFILTIIAGLLLGLSVFLQYGLSLKNATGFCIPVGIPVIIVIGYWGYRYSELSDKEEIRNTDYSQVISLFTRRPMSKWNIKKDLIMDDLLFLIPISVIIKILIFFISLYAPFESITGDVMLYYHYASNVISGQLPYSEFLLEYPPFFFISSLIAYIPQFFVHSFSAYLLSYTALMFVFDAAMVVIVYLLAFRLFGPEKAFMSGFLYVTAFAAAFFIPITYDIVPTVLLVLALLLYFYGNTISSYFVATTGTLAKWFPILTLPFFLIHAIKCKTNLIATKKGFLISGILVFCLTVPFLLISWQGYLFTYTFHISRAIQIHSFVYYCDVIFRSFLIAEYIPLILLLVLAIAEISLFFWYYFCLDNQILTLSQVIFLSVFFFVILNKGFSASYIIWLTPFLALFLVHSLRHIILFYFIQLVIYVETPLLYRIVYGTDQDYSILENGLPSFSFIFYSIKFLIFFLVFFVIFRDLKTGQQDVTRNNLFFRTGK